MKEHFYIFSNKPDFLNMGDLDASCESMEEVSGAPEQERDLSQRKSPNTGARLWDKVRGTLLRPKVTPGVGITEEVGLKEC